MSDIDICNKVIDEKTSEYRDFYSKCITSMSHLTGSMTGIVVNYITSAFGNNFFKTIWNSLSEPYVQRGAAFRDFMNKPRPQMLIIPKFDPSEEAEFRPLSEFDSEIANDPTNDIKYGLRGAQRVIDDKKFQLYFRPRRFKMSFDISCMFDSDVQRIQAQQYIRQSIRHRLPIPIRRQIENYIPMDYIQAIANMYGYELGSKELEYLLNKNSIYPIKYRFRTGTGKYEYFIAIMSPLQIQFTEAPSSDGPVKKGNIVVQSSFSERVEVEFTAPSVYFLRTRTRIGDDMIIEIEPETVTPVALDEINAESMYPPEDAKIVNDVPMGSDNLSEFVKYKSVNIQADKDGDDSINIKDLISDEQILTILEYYKQQGLVNDIINVEVYEGIYQLDPQRYVFNKSTYDLLIKNMTVYKDYYIFIYVDRIKVNDLQDKLFGSDKSTTREVII